MTILETHGVVAPRRADLLAARPLPLGAVRLLPSVLQERQRINRDVSIPLGIHRLIDAGNLENFRLIADGSGGRHGHAGAADSDVKNFVDSDLYKWLEAVGWESERGPLAAEVEALAEEAIDLIERAQDEDGYLNTWYQTQDPSTRFSNLQFGHELYCLGHLIQAAIAFRRARQDDRLLAVARRFADLVVEQFGPSGREAVCGHPEIEMALVELARETGDQRYSDLALAFVDRRGRGLLGEGRFGSGYYQDRIPYRELDTVEGHAVRALYLGSGAVDAAVEARDTGLLAASRRQWDAMVASKTYITGGVGSRHHGESFGDDYELPSDRAYCETCAAIGVVMWSWRLLLTGLDGRVADLIERSLYNGLLAGVSLDGQAYNYVNPLLVRQSHDRQPWFEIACCPPNIMRTLASIEQYVASESDDEVQLHQYVRSEITARSAELHVDTEYPLNGRVVITVKRSTRSRWTLALRVPAWADDFSVTIGGRVEEARAGADGYLRMHREWEDGDVVAVNIGMRPRYTVPLVDVEGLRSEVAVEFGPLVFCAEGVDLEDSCLGDVALRTAGAPAEEHPLDPVPIALRVPGTRHRRHERPSWPYGRQETLANVEMTSVSVTMVPYFAWGNRGSGPLRVWFPLSHEG
ncbi:beta-L-arabinofuranosidase domain-containing protein [Leifsonia sp. C5G2]|uniref:glycoside hydrolase family 127 protein n=1 Tax=Leifsonia sp. C5G2 TaxID=2735269 RepID=UPI001584A0D1|nr:beta-L-arabinofuranosidase domain-containing protein [Leifsonia sp. C5G2]NUU05229.1 glycoside hydrolase family 127 protein [Leifsonia sp. C5G2]